MPASSYLKIDLDAIESNMRKFAQKGEIMAMVKANAYGTDAIRLIPYLEAFGAAIVGVSHVNEGIALREAGIEMPIFVLSSPPFEAHLVAEYHLQPSVSSIEEVQALDQAAKQTIPVHLHVDTGMNRFGVGPENALELVKAIQEAPRLQLEGVMTHFTSAELPEFDAYTQKQISIFKEIVDSLNPLPRWIHASNGPGAERFSLPFCNLNRIGIPLFKSALTLESHLSFISRARKGDTVGYHCAYTVEKDMPIGVIPFGYHDGLHRHYKEKGYVLIHGKRAFMIGNICMDFMMVDLSSVPEACIGDRVAIFDARLPPETVASWGNTDVRELLSSIGPRTQRILIRKNDEQRFSKTLRPIEESSPSGQHLVFA